MLLKGYTLTILGLLMVSLNAQAQCHQLDFLLVRPQGTTPINIECNPSINKSKCLEKEILSKFGRIRLADGSEGWTVTADVSDARKKGILNKLKQSPVIAHINALKILARQISQTTAVCAPNLIYLGQEKLVGMGPVFFDGVRFVHQTPTGKEIHNNLMAIEDASSPDELSAVPFLPEKLLTIQSLEDSGYLMLAVAHEMAHGLMQDLYGISMMEKVLTHHHSRAGHFASALTDPALAWVEGFAEGIEAYLGELNKQRTLTPHLDQYFAHAMERNLLQKENPQAFWWSLLPATWDNFMRIGEISSLMSDFLIDERQVGIPSNMFVLKGQFVNLYHKYDVIPVNIEGDEIDQFEVETTEAIFSKEGAIAHLIYSMLKRGMAPELFYLIAKEKPTNAQQFVNLLADKLPAEKYELLRPVLNGLFTPEGRRIVRDYHVQRSEKVTKAMAHDLYFYSGTKLADIETPTSFATPREFWVEFLNSDPLHVIMSGRMDRINLAVAPAAKLYQFVRNFTETKELATTVFHKLLAMQKRTDLKGAKQWGIELLDESARLIKIGSFDESKSFIQVGLAIVDGEGCFLAKLDPKMPTCWLGEENTSVTLYFVHQIYDYVQSGKARKDFYEQTQFGQKILDLYSEYLHQTVHGQLKNEHSLFNQAARRLLQVKNYFQDPETQKRWIYVGLRPATLPTDNELSTQVNVVKEYWSSAEKRRLMQQEVFDKIPGLEKIYNFWSEPQNRYVAKEYVIEVVPGLSTAREYWGRQEKREEMKNYVTEQYYSARDAILPYLQWAKKGLVSLGIGE